MDFVFASLDAIFPNPDDLSEEYCFEELRAKQRGWLDCSWTREEKQSTDEEPQAGIQCSPEGESALNDIEEIERPIETLERKFQKTLALNDVDENGEPLEKERDVEKRLRKEEKANRTRKIKVMEVKAETQTGKYELLIVRLYHTNLRQCKQISRHQQVPD